MGSPQHIKFRSLDDFWNALPEDQLQTAQFLRDLIFTCIPEVQEKLSYNVPFYKRRKNICFIWPAAIPWGKVPEGRVQLGFTNGHLLDDPESLLEKSDRKNLRALRFANIHEIDVPAVKTFLFQAAEIDHSG